MASTTPPPPKKSGGGPLIAGAVLLLLLGAGLMYYRSRTTESDGAPVATAPTTSAEAQVFETPPPPPPPPPTPTASVDAGPDKPIRRAGSGAAGCAGPCEGSEPPGLQGQLAAKAGLARGCYERALRQNPTLAGRLLVAVKVGTTGAVCSANIAQNELGDPGVASCVAQIFRSATFTAPQGGCVDAQVPIKFSPKG